MRDTLCARCNRPISMRELLVSPFSLFSSISYSHLLRYPLLLPLPIYSPQLLPVFHSLSVAYSKCCPRTVKWTIFGCTALGLDDDNVDEEEEEEGEEEPRR